MAEQRKIRRPHTLKGASIVFNHHGSVIDCVVRNFTAEGALLQVPSTAGIPQRFEIKLASEQAYRPCRVVWRNARALGVAFS